MRFSGITDSGQKLSFLRSCAGAELMELWDKEVRVAYEATGDGDTRVEAHTYEQVVENTKTTLLKLVSRDMAIINLLRMEQAAGYSWTSWRTSRTRRTYATAGSS